MRTTHAGRNILLAEDNGIVRMLLIRVLTSAGFAVLPASDGAEALKLARQSGDIDMLLTDFNMPDMNGVDLAVAVTRDRPATKVLFVSSQVCIDLPEGSAAWRSLQKPFRNADLVATVVTMLEIR